MARRRARTPRRAPENPVAAPRADMEKAEMSRMMWIAAAAVVVVIIAAILLLWK